MLTALAILVDGFVYASWLFLIALGLTLIFGVMNILNMTHGAFYALGAYCTASAVGYYMQTGLYPPGIFIVLPVIAILGGVVAGLIVERGLLRRFEGQDAVVLVLVTYAISLILDDLLIIIWGGESRYAFEPYGMLGHIEAGLLWIAVYDLLVVGLAVFLGVVTWLCLNKTRWGHLVRAVIHDRDMAASFGVNVQWVYTVTFLIGAILAVFAGAVTAPKISVTPGIGIDVIVLAFAIVAIGGMGSIVGAAVGAIAIGLSRSIAIQFVPEIELFIVYGVMALVLVIRPEGLFARQQARKI